MGGGWTTSEAMEAVRTTEIIKQVASLFGVTAEEVMSRRRTQGLADCRTVISYVLCADYGLGFSQVGRILKRTHANVMYHVVKGGYWLETPSINLRGCSAILEMQLRHQRESA